jgi:hypothetical protein
MARIASGERVEIFPINWILSRGIITFIWDEFKVRKQA